MAAVGGLSRALPLLVVVAFTATACPLNLGPPGVDCGPLTEAECVKAAKGARMMAEGPHPDKAIWAIHLTADHWEVIFTDGSGTSVTIDRAAPPALPVRSP